ncbi:c-type cytochrome domain-containing protein [Aquisphaera insulae]|uniref:c-type cytochrome domain-containing protein n=1 Tax=Aquisphaera insulae TaxID=2712864 RepID=UPI0013EC4037|nr:c-type cytochrome domain-containing protein [Aquisphaera insulae]
MRRKLIGAGLTAILTAAIGAMSASAADDKAKAATKVTFADQVSGIFRSRCGACHNPDKAKGGLNLDSFSAAMQGGGSGKVIEPGDPDNSSLLGVIMQTEEPKMPPNSAKIPDAEIDLIRQWIAGGALETSGSVAAVKAKPKAEFKLDPASLGKPAGEPAMPVGVSTEPSTPQARQAAVVAMAASPWAPLVALGGHKQVVLYRSTDFLLVGVLPFPEGTIHSLRFSRNGDILLVGGGRGGQAGLAVAFNVKTGQRMFEVGKEYDAVLAADISPDHSMVALGGPSKMVRVYNTADGNLLFEMKKHTEWVTAVEFSPDGVLLATGDRNNGLVVWEAQTGREYFDLRGHSAAITDVSWRLDSNVLASSSEDGSVKLWEMENGNAIKSIAAHGGGVASVRFAKDGRLVTSGRDQRVRTWDPNGNKQREFDPFNDLALEAVFTQDESRVVAADWSGEVRVLNVADGKKLANLAINPAPVAVRLDLAKKAAIVARAEADSLAKQLEPLQAPVAAAAAALAKAQGDLAVVEKSAASQQGAVAAPQQAAQAKHAAWNDANAMAQAAAELLNRARGEQAAAEKAVAEAAAGEKAAAEALASSRLAVEKALADKLAHDPAIVAAANALKAAKTPEETAKATGELTKQAARAGELAAALSAAGTRQAEAQAAVVRAATVKAAAPAAVAPAQLRARAATLGDQSARELVARIAQEKAAADKALADAAAAAKTAADSLAAAKKAVENATAAKAAADKTLAEKRAPLDAATARAQALKAEVDALSAEVQRAPKGGLAATPAAGPQANR